MEIIGKIPAAGFGANAWFVSAGDTLFLIDPSVPPSEVPAFPPSAITAIFVTHGHFDHILSLDAWAESGTPVYIGKADLPALTDAYLNANKLFFGTDLCCYAPATPVSGGDELSFGDLTVRVFASPGHTVGSVVYEIGGSLFVGDTVFAGGGVGRCDLPGGDSEALAWSLRQILAFPDETPVYPGHGQATTISELKSYFL